jgi:predicted MFS family arabinose efflux permease
MRTFEFDVMGATRTYMHFYMGFGVYITVLLLLQAVVAWQLASLAHVAPRRAAPLVATLSVGSLIGTFVVWRFIFVVPALFSLACAACLTIAYVLSRSERPSSQPPQASSSC